MDRRTFLTATAAGMALGATAEARKWDGSIVRYPDEAVEVIDPRFSTYKVGNAVVERLYTGTRWAEGPVWFGDGCYLLFSDIPNNRIMRWLEETGEVSEFRNPSNNSNGNSRDLQGRLLTCERRRVTRTEYDGSRTVLIDRFEGKRMNSPNDPVVHPDGHIWFTDPGYGSLGWYEGRVEPLELPTSVYRLNPETGEAKVMTTARNRPNGICFSPDFSTLYVADTGGAEFNIYVYDVVNDSRLENERGFYKIEAGGVDGIRCDVDGNVWTSAGWGGDGIDGVHCLAPDGTLIGKIHLPETCANVCFGGEDHNRLFMMASQSVYSVYVETQGARDW